MADAVCVVTGGAGALGSELGRVLAGAGYRVALVDRAETAARLEETARTLGGGVGLPLALDIRDAHAWRATLERIERELGSIDGAVLAAGGYRGGAPLHETSADEFEAMMGINLDTARCSLQALLPPMIARGRGSVVVVGSRAAVRPWTSAGAAAYAVSKAAVVALAETAAAEALEFGVRVNSVLPSMIDTPANRRAMPDADFSRWVSPESLSRVIRFLLSDEARDVSGATVPVYGRA